MLEAVLVDVGGTLWPDGWPPEASDPQRRAAVGAALADLPVDDRRDLFDELVRSEPFAGHLEQDTAAFVTDLLASRSLPAHRSVVEAVMEAMDVPAVGTVELFPGVEELLRSIAGLELACVVVSNATWRSGPSYRRDFDAFGLGELVDAVISSVDAGYRKPDPRIFEMALGECGLHPSACVMVGNSEVNDIIPALDMGMKTIRVAIEEPPPDESRAHAVATSLDDVRALVERWCTT